MSIKSFKTKYPAFGRELAERQKWNNHPLIIFICIGIDAFRLAQNHNKDRDISAMVLAPGQAPNELIWPVKGRPVILEWDELAPESVVLDLCRCLRKAGAISVTVWPTSVDFTQPQGYYDASKPLDQGWTQTREQIRTYFFQPVEDLSHAA